MYFDTKKKEFKINGKLSILKTKSMKMDYPNNVHLKDNDIFEVKKRFNLNPNSSFSREETIDKIIRVYRSLLYRKRLHIIMENVMRILSHLK